MRYIYIINDYNNIIAEFQKLFQKLYDQTPTTNRTARASILNGLKQSKRELVKTQAEYEMFKKYKTRTTISK